jgi:hypothetical protein
MRYIKPDEDSKKAFKLFNIRTGELLRLEASMNELNHIMLTEFSHPLTSLTSRLK